MAAAMGPNSRPAVALWTTLGAATIVIVTFIVDLILPLGYAGAMPYVIAVVLGLWAPTSKLALATATAATVLAVVAVPLESRQAVPAYLWVINRTVALIAIWAVAFAVVRYKSFERRVREEQTKTQVILDTSADGLITIDERGTIELFNRAAERIFGWTQEEVLGKNLSLLMPLLEAQVIGSGREVEGLRRDGSVFPMDLAVSEVKLDHRRLFTGSVRDITARKQAERERESLIHTLEQKNTELERFTYTVSHDLKSPLVTIKGFLGTLERSAREGNLERLTADVARISAAADRMKQLLDELLELSRIGRVASPPVELPLAELAREAADSLAGLSSERGAKIEIAADLPVVLGDRTRVVEVLQNLIENALKFAGPQASPRIEVGTRSDAGETVIFVRDNGMGIDNRYKDKIFGLFEKLDKNQAGTGVGLALVKRIVEVHGGRVWVESEGQGTGACFCFTLGAPPTQPRSAA
jgi:PAS domain S-box-containing protein